MADKSYKKYLKEAIDDFDMVDVTSDNIDPFMNPDSANLNTYSNDDGIDIHDNTALYDIVKIFKDVTERNPNSFQAANFAIDVNKGCIIFNLVSDNDSFIMDDVVRGIVGAMQEQVTLLYGDSFIFELKQRPILGDIGQGVGLTSSLGKTEYLIYVKENKEEN